VIRSLKFGVIAPNYNAPKKIAEFARVAEESGFDHFLLSDHYWYVEEPDFLDSWTMLAYLAGETSTLRLGTWCDAYHFSSAVAVRQDSNYS
jgi:alkanesulfonate monooxygenase SsuD/methylene tetrahydromethanopterin reductase-like flavin-dependent oxidoreductase (luciferase family)